MKNKPAAPHTPAMKREWKLDTTQNDYFYIQRNGSHYLKVYGQDREEAAYVVEALNTYPMLKEQIENKRDGLQKIKAERDIVQSKYDCLLVVIKKATTWEEIDKAIKEDIR